MALTGEEIQRYQRQISVDNIGEEGQEKLKGKKALVIGTGGLGSPAAFYLAAMGVGALGLVDDDAVDVSNLQRQILHSEKNIGSKKVDSAKERIRELNGHIDVKTYAFCLNEYNAEDIISEYDVVVDAVDNFDTRFVVNDACYYLGIPLVEAGVVRWEGQVMTIIPGEGPCYRCVFGKPPEEGAVQPPAEAGVLGVMPGVIGTLQALEAVKVLLSLGRNLSGRLLVVDGINTSFREVKIGRNSKCPLCGENS